MYFPQQTIHNNPLILIFTQTTHQYLPDILLIPFGLNLTDPIPIIIPTMKGILIAVLMALVCAKVDISLYRNHIHNHSQTEKRLTEIKEYTSNYLILFSGSAPSRLLVGQC